MDQNSIIRICDDLHRPLENVIKNGVKSYNIETLDCADLRDFNYDDIRKSEEFGELFDRLHKITGSVVYGTDLLNSLSNDLKIRYGKGFSRRSVLDMRRFYVCYPIWQTVSAKLSWSH